MADEEHIQSIESWLRRLIGRPLRERNQAAYHEYRKQHKSEIGTTLLSDDLMSRCSGYGSIFESIIPTDKIDHFYHIPNYLWQKHITEGTPLEKLVPEKAAAILEEVGDNLERKLSLDWDLAATHALLENNFFSLVGYKQFVEGSFPLRVDTRYRELNIPFHEFVWHSFLFASQSGGIYYWKPREAVCLKVSEFDEYEKDITAMPTTWNMLKADEYDRERRLLREMMFVPLESELDKLCLELTGPVTKQGRMLVIKTLERLNFEEENQRPVAVEEGKDSFSGRDLLVMKYDKSPYPTRPGDATDFQILYKQPIGKGNPLSIRNADPRCGYDGIMDIRESKLIGDRAIPYQGWEF
ncbi:hypothetical protein HZB02_07755 [Candidatus Woesearchaeota archaeon]|nr:hypothetical protein [Candidatus Woesearchaeota archaeon]